MVFRRLASTVFLLTLCNICSPALSSQKISSIDLDIPPLPSAKQQISDQQTAPVPATPSSSGGSILSNSPVAAIPRANTVDWDSPTLAPSSSSMPSPAPSLLTKNIQNKPLEISVPSYEKEYQEMLEKQRIDQEARKKKKFTDALKEDIRRHGLLLLLGFVVLLIVYALRKERTPAKSVREQEQPPAPPEPPSGKDIWHEDF